jgi:hypothetical protein
MYFVPSVVTKLVSMVGEDLVGEDVGFGSRLRRVVFLVGKSGRRTLVRGGERDENCRLSDSSMVEGELMVLREEVVAV